MKVPRPDAYSILVVDDEALVLETTAELLATAGHRVLVASGGEEALLMAQAVRVDLILVDHYMPGMTGLELVQRLKADEATRRVPIVALTAAVSEVANALTQAGCIGFIPKPIDPKELRQLIADILNATVGRTRHTTDECGCAVRTVRLRTIPPPTDPSRTVLKGPARP